ncbi:hypothetical protein B10172_14870 [Campylobacter jejuni]|nr:hypothetical protein B10172_14870 [Campylobacter jejuni]
MSSFYEIIHIQIIIQRQIRKKFLNNQWIDNYVVYVNKIEDYNNIEMQYYWGFNTNHSNLIWTVKEINKEYCKISQIYGKKYNLQIWLNIFFRG